MTKSRSLTNDELMQRITVPMKGNSEYAYALLELQARLRDGRAVLVAPEDVADSDADDRFDEGYDAGAREGYNDGFDEGHAVGYREGLADGETKDES